MGTRGGRAVAAGVIICLPIVAAPPSDANAASKPLETGRIRAGVTLSGVVARNAREAARFGAWRGSRVTVVDAYLHGTTWSSIADTRWTAGHWAGGKYHYVWSMWMLPQKGKATLAAGAKGSYNKYFRRAAQGLVANGYGSSTIRLGWELTGNWERWYSGKHPQQYAAYWRQIVRTMRSVPGAHFTFDWNISDQKVNPRPAYPGDRYVDYIGGDLYDESWVPGYRASNHVKVWHYLRTKPYGFDWLARFAKAHHKRLAFGEWALVYRCDGHGGGDDPYYIRQMHHWIATHDVAYETYFNGEDNRCQTFSFSSRHFPHAATTYRALWRRPF
jgi:hypothetical protein